MTSLQSRVSGVDWSFALGVGIVAITSMSLCDSYRPRGLRDPAMSPNHSIEMCLGSEAQETIADGSGAGGSTMATG